MDTSAQTTLKTFVIGSGGTIMAGNGQPNSFISATIGQPLISKEAVAASTSRWEGFWVPAIQNNTSVDEETTYTSGDVHVYPNPMRESSRLTFDSKLEGIVTVRLYDAVGTLVQSIEKDLSVAGDQTIPLSVMRSSGELMSSGTYQCIIDGSLHNGQPYHAAIRLSVVK